MIKQQVVFILIGILLSSCAGKVKDSGEKVKDDFYHPEYNHQDSCNNTEFTYIDFKINDLALNERAYIGSKTTLELPVIRDDNNILLHSYRNKLDYHPVAMATYALSLLDLYRRTKDSTCLELAIDHADKLLGISLQIDSTILFPYSFNYKFYEKDLKQAPWYSGMAQGKTLSLFSRLYEITSNKKYLDIASQIYLSFYRLKATHTPWISCIDTDSSLWFEEYPYEQPSHVLNGKIFAIFGVYDYYMIDKRKEVSILLKGAITTVKRNMHLIRNEDDTSYYGFKFNVKNPRYHTIHIDQFEMLYKISGILDFKKMSDNLLKDTSVKPL